MKFSVSYHSFTKKTFYYYNFLLKQVIVALVLVIVCLLMGTGNGAERDRKNRPAQQVYRPYKHKFTGPLGHGPLG